MPLECHAGRGGPRWDEPLTGGVAAGSSANAATNTPTSANTRADASASPGVFVSNEDPAHDATESAEREAQEDAGQRPTVS